MLPKTLAWPYVAVMSHMDRSFGEVLGRVHRGQKCTMRFLQVSPGHVGIGARVSDYQGNVPGMYAVLTGCSVVVSAQLCGSIISACYASSVVSGGLGCLVWYAHERWRRERWKPPSRQRCADCVILRVSMSACSLSSLYWWY